VVEPVVAVAKLEVEEVYTHYLFSAELEASEQHTPFSNPFHTEKAV